MLCVGCAIIMIGICVAGSSIDTESPAAVTTTLQEEETQEKIPITKPPKETVTEQELTPAQEQLKRMSLEEKVGQLFIVTPEALLEGYELDEADYDSITSLNKEIEIKMNRFHIGGIIMFASNITDPDQIYEFNKSIVTFSRLSPFICIDEEGGAVARIAGNDEFDVPRYDSMREVGSTDELENAYNVGVNIGTYLKEYGFNLDLAPVADLDAGNSAIGERAFSDGPRLAGNMVASEINGFHSVGIMCCTKHFPGHGSATGDTHNGSVELEKNMSELEEYDLVPFRYAIDADTDMIMMSHLLTPYITNDGLPASMSYQMITSILRGELEYEGVIITDSFEMEAVSDNYSSGEVAVNAIKAGADIVLMPQSIDEAYNAIINAVKSGELDEEELDRHIMRILLLKEKYGLISSKN